MNAPLPSAVLLQEMHDTLNKHDLSFKESFMALSYLTVVVARAGGLSVSQIQDAVERAYEVDQALDMGMQ